MAIWSLVLIRMLYSQILNTEIEIQGSWLLFDPHHSFRAPDMEGERNEPAWEGSQLDTEAWKAEGLHLSFFPPVSSEMGWQNYKMKSPDQQLPASLPLQERGGGLGALVLVSSDRCH